MSEKKPEESKAPAVETAPDPDEDDLDDLDAVLDEFANTKIDSEPEAPPSAPSSSGPGRPPAPGLQFSDDDFQKELQKGMADLLGEFENSPDMKNQFEGLLKELGDAAASGTDPLNPTAAAPKTEAGSSTQPKAESSFQETIKKTMERMQESGAQASAAASSNADMFNEDMMSQLLLEMTKDGGGGEEGIAKMLSDMMEELTNKEVLYEPMKELDDKFPEWMAKNKDKTPKEDLDRYEEQKSLVKEIVDKFEQKDYSDQNPKDREYIVERMQKMQSVGSPPPDLVGSTNAAAEALAGMDEGCPQQ